MNRTRSLTLLALTAPFALLACAAAPPGGGDESNGQSSAATTTISSAEAAAILDLVNYPDTDLTLLDVTIDLDSRAAKNIVAARNGADGICPSADDVPFTTLASLEALPYVATSAIAKLGTYATAHPAPKGEVVEGVTFAGWQSFAVVWGVDRDTEADLDAFLDSRAARSLVAGRPFTTVTQMGPMSYVGPTALTALRAHALGWWTASKAPGFVLDATTLANDAELLKESLAEDEGFTEYLSTLGGGNGEGVVIIQALEAEIDRLVAPLLGTTYGDANAAEAAVDAAAPVKDRTKAGGWAYLESIGVTPPTALACVAAFETAVSPHLGDLLFMSESDRPFDLVAYEGGGTSAPTAASVLALVGAPAGSTAQVRATGDYFTAFEPSSSAADPSAAADVQNAFTAQLTDVVYVAVFAPPGSVDTSLVDVYLVGRTTCGDLVGLHAIAVET
jgi:hypothetical protein